MLMVRHDLVSPRHAVFGGVNGDGDFELLGVDYSADDFDMQIRAAPGMTGDPLINLGLAAAGSTGMVVSYHADWVHPVTGAVVGGTLLRIQINVGDLAALPYAADDPSQPLELAYDIRRQPLYGPSSILAEGKFIVNPGVTI
ncbi:hypothetical protein [Novosphingobium sp. SG707]|uniref:hypothetical protein n=1 Tax=Novosphingobium sp. SG707 TaxID=2586996 RepID=UPI0014486A23|nr:hypothetical protein [Novosphingobium sp. SG707]NKI99578.1 hypothetical protein [Novosphingobium sp. SG707]